MDHLLRWSIEDATNSAGSTRTKPSSWAWYWAGFGCGAGCAGILLAIVLL